MAHKVIVKIDCEPAVICRNHPQSCTNLAKPSTIKNGCYQRHRFSHGSVIIPTSQINEEISRPAANLAIRLQNKYWFNAAGGKKYEGGSYGNVIEHLQTQLSFNYYTCRGFIEFRDKSPTNQRVEPGFKIISQNRLALEYGHGHRRPHHIFANGA